jgi:cation transport ATPase
MEEQKEQPEIQENQKDHGHRENHRRRKHKQPRPVILTCICISAFVFYGLISLFLFILMFLSGWIARSEARKVFLPDWVESKLVIVVVIIVAFLLHLTSLIGAVKMWYRRKSGYLMLSSSSFAIALFQLFTDRISIFTTAVYLCFVLLFGFYYRRFR